jgi:hypothetical protein
LASKSTSSFEVGMVRRYSPSPGFASLMELGATDLLIFGTIGVPAKDLKVVNASSTEFPIEESFGSACKMYVPNKDLILPLAPFRIPGSLPGKRKFGSMEAAGIGGTKGGISRGCFSLRLVELAREEPVFGDFDGTNVLDFKEGDLFLYPAHFML